MEGNLAKYLKDVGLIKSEITEYKEIISSSVNFGDDGIYEYYNIVDKKMG